MGWSIGYDERWGKHGRDIGYGVPATCDHPGCGARIDRGLSYVCGSDPYGGDHGCGLYFCGSHLHFEDRGDECPQLCERCAAEEGPFEPTPDVQEWVDWKLSDESWGPWRAENPEAAAAMRAAPVQPDSEPNAVREPQANTDRIRNSNGGPKPLNLNDAGQGQDSAK